jgi:hypothetical protein
MTDCTCPTFGQVEDPDCPQHGIVTFLQQLSDHRFDDSPRLTNPRRPAICETYNCEQPTVRQVVNVADNTTGWYCDDCSSELPALFPYLRAVYP